MSCPINSLRFNASLCACPPGHLLDRTTNTCVLFGSSPAIVISQADSDAVSFPVTIFSFDSLRMFMQSQAVFLQATLVMLASWLFFCLFLRFMKLGDGRNIWFRMRWWVSRLDLCFATTHWLDDQKVITKRKTELGGTFSIASWILFIGLFAALLYQIISKRSIEVHNIKAAHAPDMASFVNDMEYNITTVSTMSCANVRDLGTIVFGNPGFLKQKVMPLSNFANYSCHNNSDGPTVRVQCRRCRFIQDKIYISWQFVDLPSSPASAVGFQFNLSARNHPKKDHASFLSGILKNVSSFDDTPVTFRGKNANIVQFNLFPRIYVNQQDSKLLQPLFHEFVPGSFFQKASDLQTSLENSNDGVLNVTLFINLLSSYIVEIENQNIFGPVSFLADLGGLYCISVAIFLYLVVQFEYRIKKLHDEDSVMRNIRNRKIAQDHWNKLRKYVMFTWGCSTMDDYYNDLSATPSCADCMVQSSLEGGLLRKRKAKSGYTTFRFNRQTAKQDTESLKATATGSEMKTITTKQERPLINAWLCGQGKQSLIRPCEGDSSQLSELFHSEAIIPPPPTIEFKDSSDIDMFDVLEKIKSLYEYNVILRDKLLATESEIRSLAIKSS
ncbi:uncharacterized protein LOC111472540 isoform X1 [Cucurbita maxima]|uniref:Uncharacterized protein LOC111472540 isoform X1 n=1 Tax=Cucurbita maxima TaxID=3661 RepID=A0A6J1I8T2_CUCMA|nr:uncharacterized protein LOC111472540 isoform X1 [Cucurbita maxima]